MSIIHYPIVLHNDTTIISVLWFSAVTGSQQDTYRCNATSTAGSNFKLIEVSLSGKIFICSISYQLTGRKSNPTFTADKTLL